MRLLKVSEAAQSLGVSSSWVRRHANDLQVIRVGRAVRFDSELLSQQFQTTMRSGKSLKPERDAMPSRYQRGSVTLKGKKQKMWYGVYREDVRQSDGTLCRHQRNIRLGTLAELPTKNAARKKLAELMDAPIQSEGMTFKVLAERWTIAEGPTMKPTTLSHYSNALRAYVHPTFGERDINSIRREEIQKFLALKAVRYSQSVLRSIRVVLSLVLGWAAECELVQKNPCAGIKLPRVTGGRKVTRTVLTAEQTNAIAAKLKEPYSTLVLFIAATGLRISEAIAVKWSHIENSVLHVRERVYDGELDAVKSKASERDLPLEPELLARMKALGNSDWVFCSEAGTPVNPANALKRYLRPAVNELGIALGGWHDFRHTLTTNMRRKGVHPKVVSGILGHSKVSLAMDVYDRVTVEDFRSPMANVAGELLSSVIN